MRVVLHASHLVVYDQNVEVARHERLIAKGSCRLDLDHYLEALIRKPGAFPGATALEQARSAGRFTPVHDAWWAQARKIHGEQDGTRALIEVLLLNRYLAHEHVVAGLATALRPAALTADAVALEARKAAQSEDEPTIGGSIPADPGQSPATVTSLHEWRLAHLPPDTRPLPSVTPYDQLLRSRRTSGSDHREEKHSDPAPPARLDRAGSRHRNRHRLPPAAAPLDPQRVQRDRRPGGQGPDDLPRLPRRAADDRVRRPGPPPLGTTDQSCGFPREKSLRAFDFDANPNIDAATIHTLASCEWIKKSQPLCLIGDSGTGKSHMLIALGTEAAMKGYRVRYTLATKLVNELVEAADEKQLNKTIARYGRVDLLCIDELGYMELDRHGAELLFQVLTEREEKNSVAIASNESFGGWTKTFTDPRLCAAIVDRLTFNGTIIETGTDSYRLASTRARAEEPAAG